MAHGVYLSGNNKLSILFDFCSKDHLELLQGKFAVNCEFLGPCIYYIYYLPLVHFPGF